MIRLCANAQVLAPSRIAAPTQVAAICSGVRKRRAWLRPRLLPPLEVYTVVRGSGFSPLGIPKQRGFVYTIAVIDRGGDDGRLVIDARNGQIIRFMPASRMGSRFGDAIAYGPPGRRRLAMLGRRRGRRAMFPRSQAARLRPRRHMPAMPRRSPPSRPPRRCSKRQPHRPNRPSRKPPGRAAAPAQAAAPAMVEAKPAPQIAPTQDMPKVQGLE